MRGDRGGTTQPRRSLFQRDVDALRWLAGVPGRVASADMRVEHRHNVAMHRQLTNAFGTPRAKMEAGITYPAIRALPLLKRPGGTPLQAYLSARARARNRGQSARR